MKHSNLYLITKVRQASEDAEDPKTALALAEAAERMEDLIEKLSNAESILWMAEKYAEAGGSGGPEMREFNDAMKVIES